MKHAKPANMRGYIAKGWKVFCALGVVISVLGYSARDLIEKDWQQISEQKNSEALELYDKGYYDEAIELYNYVLSLKHKHIHNLSSIYFNRGMAYFQKGEFENAVDDFTDAIELEPKSKYFANRALAYENLGYSSEALEDYLQAIIP